NRGNYCERRAMTLPQYYDREERDWLCEKLRDGGVFLDIGGNVGLFSLTVAGRLREKVKVFTVEPDPQMYERMLFNAKQNNLDINLATVALSDYEGEGELQLAPQQRGKNALVEGGGDEQAIAVRVTTLLALCQEWGVEEVTAMKIDVEGHEHRILAHFMENAAQSLWPKSLVIEHVHGADSIVDMLKSRYEYQVESETKLNLLLVRR
ncbi:MAG: FkbM family methyltransferase, partial [Granulosicoccaceae bacterium]